MSRVFSSSLCSLAASGFFASSALAVDPFFPTFGNNGIDVSRYTIDLDVNPVSGAVKGRTTLAITAEKRLANFSLDLHGLKVSSVLVNGLPARTSRMRNKLAITPAQVLPALKPFSVTVSYSGTPVPLPDPTAAPGKELYLGWAKHQNFTYVVSEPVGASNFFPSNDEPTDKATYTFRITVPLGYRAVANGKPVKTLTTGSKTKYEWSMAQPMTTWLATVHVNKLKVYSKATSGGLPVRIYSPSDIPQSHVVAYARAAQMIPYFESLVGKYPFASYGSIVVEDPSLYYALETQAMSTFPGQPVPPDDRQIAHELAHQWFGNAVSIAKWEDLWIAEGAATYFEIQWVNRNSPAAFNKAMVDNYEFVVDSKLGPAVVESRDQLFSKRTYSRGAATYYALRQTVGSAVFLNILRSFYAENRGGNVTSQDFINTAVRVSGKEAVRSLLNSWLYQKAVPKLPGALAKTAAKAALPKAMAQPDLFGYRCGLGSHRGAARTC